jgi:hypothetical protein
LGGVVIPELDIHQRAGELVAQLLALQLDLRALADADPAAVSAKDAERDDQQKDQDVQEKSSDAPPQFPFGRGIDFLCCFFWFLHGFRPLGFHRLCSFIRLCVIDGLRHGADYTLRGYKLRHFFGA